MKTSNVEKLLGKNFCKRNGIDPTNEYEIEYVPARSLLTYDRFDLIAKLAYIEAYAAGWKTDFFQSLYAAHIEAFSRGTYVERDQEDTKNSLALYIEMFQKLYQDIKINGFNPDTSVVPVGANNAILDGAHRTACAAQLNIEIPIIRFPNLPLHCGFRFFEERLLDIQFLDYLACKYCRLDPHIRFALIGSCANEKSAQKIDAERMLGESCTVVWKRTLSLSSRALKTFISSLSSSFDQPETAAIACPSSTACEKTAADRKTHITLFMLDCAHAEAFQKTKQRMMDSLRKSNAFGLVSDTHAQAVEISQILLNKNGRNFLKFADPDRFPGIQGFLSELKNRCQEKRVSPDSFVVSGDAVPALYGIRDGDTAEVIFDMKTDLDDGIIARSARSAPVNADDLVHNPANYFWYRGMKFATLSQWAALKKGKDRTAGDAFGQNEKKRMRRIMAEERQHLTLSNMRFKIKKSVRNLKYKIYPFILHNPLTALCLKCYHFLRHRRWF